MTKRPVRLLVVDDDESNRDMLSRRLRRSGYDVETAGDGRNALDLLAARLFDLVLLDNMMPGLSGVEVLRRLRETHSASGLPVIMVTAQCENDNVVNALRLGANDYITKPVNFEVAVARIETQLAQHAAERRLLRHAEDAKNVDPVTSLPNRTWLEERVRHIRSSASPARALLIIEPDQFDRARETLSPKLSEGLLTALARRLQEFCRSFCKRPVAVARCGEQQFAILVSGKAAGDPSGIAVRLRSLFREPFQVEEQPIFLLPTIGIAVCGAGERGDGLLRDGLAALRHAREQGIGHCEIFTPAMRQQDIAAVHLESDLLRAVERREFLTYYQPKVNLETGRIDGFEALVRWRRPDGRLAAPAEFIATAERTGLVVPIGKWVMDQACRDTVALRRSFPGVGVSVNVSARQFIEPDLFDSITDSLRSSGLPPAALRLEVTESVLITNPESALEVLRRVRALGVGLKLDDFGTGYSSLSYLHQFPFDTLKIDRTFVSRLTSGGDGLPMVQLIIDLARTLNLKIVAEGLDTLELARIARELGCHYGQGFYFSRPVALADLRQVLADWNPEQILALLQPSPVEQCQPAA